MKPCLFKRIQSHHVLKIVACYVILLSSSFTLTAQSYYGQLQGTIRDGSTNMTLSGVSVSRDSLKVGALSMSDGKYNLNVVDGASAIYFSYDGYQTKIIKKVNIRSSTITRLDIILYPVSSSQKNTDSGKALRDSARPAEKTVSSLLSKEQKSLIYNPLKNGNIVTDIINVNDIHSGTDKNTSRLLNRLNGVVVQNSLTNPQLQSFIISGMGERYNQVTLNGAMFNSADANARAYPLELLPAEAIESVVLHQSSKASLPSDFAGGSIEIKTRDMPEKNFFLVQVGSGFADATRGKEFFGDKKNDGQFLSFPGSIRNLPAAFPTTRSQTNFYQKNLQEQNDLARQLRNNLGPLSYGTAKPDDRIMIGFGKVYRFKKGLTMGITGYINHIGEQTIEESFTQVLPDVANNPYPFSDPTKKLLASQSKDTHYRYSAQLGAVLNAAFYFRNNKISIRNYWGNQFYNSYSQRSEISKPDEDTLATNGIRYLTEQKTFGYTQIAGEHQLGSNSKFLISWQGTYNYLKQENPDERNFLLRKDSNNNNLFEIATAQSLDFDPASPASHASNFTNSSRLWRRYTEQNFNASLNLKVPVNVLGHPQLINGGLFMNSISRDFKSDLLLVKGKGFSELGNLLSSDRYYPGGLTVTNYFSNLQRQNNSPVYDINKANYFASSNVAASFLYFENRFPGNIYLQWGARLESGNLSSSTVQHEYAPGYRYPQKFAIVDNSRKVRFDILPSANIMYSPLPSIQINGTYARTLNRPQLQELNAYQYYDAGYFMVKTGNPFLDVAVIDNVSAGIKWLKGANTYVSASAFYKKIDQPIEEVISQYSTGNMTSTPFNMPPATVKGLRADVRLNLGVFADNNWLSHVSIFGSGTYLESEVEAGPLRSNTITKIATHTLSGSPDYSYNVGMVVQDVRYPELSVIYNRTGDYITKVGSGNVITLANGNQINTMPDYRVKGRGQLDAQIAQKFFQSKLQLIAGATNILDEAFVEYQDLDGNDKFDAPLSVTSGIKQPGFYRGGGDNAIYFLKSQRRFYLRLSYVF